MRIQFHLKTKAAKPIERRDKIDIHPQAKELIAKYFSWHLIPKEQLLKDSTSSKLQELTLKLSMVIKPN